MIPEQSNDDHLNNPGFQALLVECLEKLERGESLDADHLLEANPEHAASLAAFLTDQAMLRRVASKVRDSQSGRSRRQPEAPVEETIDSNPKSNGFTAGDRLRYIGEYEILEEIARGGMGIVFKARQQKLKRVVALKMILSGQLADAGDVERFHREARAAGQLKHPNIVPIHEIGEHDGHHYFTMDYIDGHSLSDEIRDESLPPRRAADLIRKVAEAVEFAHRHGTLHRDLKPANILIDGEDQPHVTDFGLAKVVGDDEARAELTASGQILGTPSYMAPEQAAGKHSHVGPASDVYSLGAVLYACLTGRAPFVADSPVDTLLQVMNKDPVAARDLNPSVPNDLDTICLKCLQKEPHRRYGTAQLLADDLERFLDGRPVLARPISRTARAWRWCRRNPAPAASIIIGLVLLLTLAVGAPLVAWQQKRIANQQTDFAASQSRFAAQERDLRLAAEDAERDERKQRERADANAAEAQKNLLTAERALRLANRQLYSNRIALAQREWNDGNTSAALDSLDQCQKDLRGWEHDYLFTTFQQYHRTLRGHTHFVNSVHLVHGQRQIISAGLNETVLVWNTDGGEVVKRLSVSGMIQAMDVNPDATRLVVAGRSSFAKIIDAETGETLLVLKGHRKQITDVTYSPDGALVATAGLDGSVRIWNSQTGELQHTLPLSQRPVRCVAFSPNGSQIMCGGEELTLWNVNEMTRAHAVSLPTTISSAAFSSTGQTIAAGGYDGSIYIWKVGAEDNRTVDARHRGRVTAVCFAPDDTWVISSAEEDTRALRSDVATGKTLGIYRGHSRGIPSLIVSSDGSSAVSGGFDGMVKIWDLTKAQGIQTLTADPAIVSAGYANVDGQILVGLRDGSVCTMDAASGRRRRSYGRLKSFVTRVQATADGKLVFGVDQNGNLAVWRHDDPTMIFSQEQAVWDFAVSDNGARLATASRTTSPGVVLGLRTFEVVAEFDGQRPITIGSSGKLVGAAVDHGWRFHVKNVVAGSEELAIPRQPQPCSAAMISPDNRYLAVSSFERTSALILIFDLTTGKKKHELRGHAGPVNCLAFHPDGSRLATGAGDATVKIWDLETGIETLTLRGHSRGIEDLMFRRDGNQLLSLGSDGEVRLWDADKSDPGIERPQPFVDW